MLRIIFSILLVVSMASTGWKSNELAGTKADLKTDDSKTDKEQVDIESLKSYKTITREHESEWDEIKVSYPLFSYSELDDIISMDMEGRFDREIEKLEEFESYTEENEGEDLYNQNYIYSISFEEPIMNENFISITFIEYVYDGGVHGDYWATPFNYDLKKNEVITIEGILEENSTDLETIAEITYNKIKFGESDIKYFEDHLKKYTAPTIENYQAFALTEDSLIIIFQPYAIAPFSEGIVRVEIRWDEIDK